MSDKSSKKPADPMPAPAASALVTAIADAPESVREALGGAPLTVPAPRPGQRPVETGAPHRRGVVPTAGTVPIRDRVSNPLFDGPAPRLAKARVSVANVRNAFGDVVRAMDVALALAEASASTYGDTYAEAAAIEGFDLAAAAAVAAEWRAFLDRHKPQAPVAS